MDINKKTLEHLLEPSNFNYIYSDEASKVYGLDVDEFEKAVEEYKHNFTKVKIHENQHLFHIKATSIISQLFEFYEHHEDITKLSKSMDALGSAEKIAIINKSKQVFSEGINILAPYCALLIVATKTNFKA